MNKTLPVSWESNNELNLPDFLGQLVPDTSALVVDQFDLGDQTNIKLNIHFIPNPDPA